MSKTIDKFDSVTAATKDTTPLIEIEATPEFHRFGNLGLYYLQVNHDAGKASESE